MDRGDIIIISSGSGYIPKDAYSGVLAYGDTIAQAIETLERIISERNTKYESA